MPRKTRPVSIETVTPDPAPVKLETPTHAPVTTPDTPDAQSTVAEASEADVDTASIPKRPRKKLRRPTLSDTIPAIPVASFGRMVRHMAEECKSDLRWEAEALEALQVDAEAYLIQRFQKAKETMELFGRKSGGRQLKELIRV